MPYPEELLVPMRKELVDAGATELLTADEVDQFMSEKTGTSLLIVNSVCGCAAGSARPGLRMALDNGSKPARVATVFAGQDVDAVSRARSYFADIPPSSPCFALFKDGELVDFLPRHMIEGSYPEHVATALTKIFDNHC